MLTESARVIRRDGNRVVLELQRGSACGNCEMSQGCGTGALGRLLGKRLRPLVVETDQDYRPGDEVELALPEATLVRASLLVYGLPLLGMLLGGSVASVATASDWLVAVAVCAGFLAGFLCAAFSTSRLEQRGMAPHIRGIRLNSVYRSRSIGPYTISSRNNT
jgi:sigma-E factor negative regulatory protein RseC